jgi:hypothetical protein
VLRIKRLIASGQTLAMISIYKKKKSFNLQARLDKRRDGKRNIEFDRLPRKKVKPLWWSVLLFIIVASLFLYLGKI